MTRHPLLTEQERVARDRRKFVKEWLPLDVPAFVAQVKALPVFKDCPRSIARTKVKIVYTAFETGGRAHGNRMARIRVSPSADIAWITETIVHELVHCALPDGVVHGERFRLTLARAVKELWGIEVDPNPAKPSGRVGVYDLDRNIEQHLRTNPDDYPYPVRQPQAPPTDRKTVMATIVEKRAAHAARMLDKAEKRAKLAQRVLSKWRQKVRYYERQAARKT